MSIIQTFNYNAENFKCVFFFFFYLPTCTFWFTHLVIKSVCTYSICFHYDISEFWRCFVSIMSFVMFQTGHETWHKVDRRRRKAFVSKCKDLRIMYHLAAQVLSFHSLCTSQNIYKRPLTTPSPLTCSPFFSPLLFPPLTPLTLA